MSTLDDLRAEVEHDAMLERCEALHTEPEGEAEYGCRGCEERAQLALEDELNEAVTA